MRPVARQVSCAAPPPASIGAVSVVRQNNGVAPAAPPIKLPAGPEPSTEESAVPAGNSPKAFPGTATLGVPYACDAPPVGCPRWRVAAWPSMLCQMGAALRAKSEQLLVGIPPNAFKSALLSLEAF